MSEFEDRVGLAFLRAFFGNDVLHAVPLVVHVAERKLRTGKRVVALFELEEPAVSLAVRMVRVPLDHFVGLTLLVDKGEDGALTCAVAVLVARAAVGNVVHRNGGIARLHEDRRRTWPAASVRGRLTRVVRELRIDCGWQVVVPTAIRRVVVEPRPAKPFRANPPARLVPSSLLSRLISQLHMFN